MSWEGLPLLALSALLALFPPMALAGEVLTCDFSGEADLARWDIRSQDGGMAVLDDGALLLDMSAARKGKSAWADLLRTIKLPATIEWDQQISRDSEHLYQTGIVLRGADGSTGRAGLSGKPLGHVAHLGGRRGTTALEPGRWYRLRLELPDDRQATLTVCDRDGGAEQDRLSGSVGPLRGQLCALGLYHNQPREEGADQYEQDRGASRFDNLRVSAAAISDSPMDQYRDQSMRDYSPRAPMTYNKATRWVECEGTTLAYDEGREVLLTGTRQASAWLPGRLCAMDAVDETTSVFTRPNDLDGYDRAALPSFQWCVRQHPRLQYRLSPRAGQCYLKVTLVCPYLGDGIEVLRTEPGTREQTGVLDLWAAMERRGLGFHQFSEIGVYVYQDRPPDAEAKQGACEVNLRLTGDGALLTGLPVVRTQQRAEDGVPICALLAGPEGVLCHAGQVSITAAADGGAPVDLSEVGRTGVFRAFLRGLAVGEHSVELVAAGADGSTWQATTTATVTDGDFLTWQPGIPTYQTRSGRTVPTLLGDLYAWVPMLNAGSVDRRVVVSTAEWERLSAEQKAAVQLVKLRTLNRDEVRAQLEAHHANGIRVVRLTPNVSTREAYLDAGGHMAMHGMETLMLVLSECRRLGIVALINVFHYPYWSGGTGSFPPWQSYVDAGYARAEDFTSPQIGVMLKQYLAETLGCLRDETAVLGYSLTGENDQAYGLEWINDLYAHVMRCDPNHMVTQEQGGGAQHCAGGTPWGYDEYKPTKSAGLGYRTYYTDKMKSDAYFMVCGRFYAANAPVFTAEFASGPGWYGSFWQNWTHPDFLSKVRDNCWASLLCRQTMCMSWSAPWTQEERVIPHRCSEQIDWGGFRRKTPLVAIRLEKLSEPVLRNLTEYESTLARMGVDYDLLWEGRDTPRASYAVVLDAATPSGELALAEAVLAARPMAVSEGYSASYLLSEDSRQMIAFVKNTAEYRLGPGYGTGVNELHRQRTWKGPLTIGLQGFSDDATFWVYDVDTRELVVTGPCGEAGHIDLRSTGHDFAVVVKG